MTRAVRALAPVALALAAALGGCDGAKEPEGGRVAIIDLTQVAKDAGREEGFERRLQASAQDIESKLTTYRDQLKALLDAEKAKLGPVPTREQLDGLQQKVAQADEQLRRARVEAQTRMQQIRAAMVGEFRDEIRPLATRVARARGLSVVMLKHEGILEVDPSADITEDVTRELKALGPPPQVPATAPATRPATQPATRPTTRPRRRATTRPGPIVPLPPETEPEFFE